MMDPAIMSFKHTQITGNDEEEFYITISCNDQGLFNALHRSIDEVLTEYLEPKPEVAKK